MISDEQLQRLKRALPLLTKADPAMQVELQQQAFYLRIPSGRDVFVEGDAVGAIALLLSGAVRVYKVGETGREITLYRFGTGESCILTANAILSGGAFSAIATVERDVEAIMIEADIFRDWVRRYDLWREFVFQLLSQRLASVMALVDEVAFQRMDVRVADLLLERSRPRSPLQITHQEIAAELGSSREVISRILENLAARGMIRIGRGQIEITDEAALIDYAAR